MGKLNKFTPFFFAVAAVSLLLFQNCGGFAPAVSSLTSSSDDGGGGSLQVVISWAVPSTGEPAGGYLIEQSSDNAKFEPVRTVTGDVTSATITGLSPQKYYFRVSSVNTAASAPSVSTPVDLSAAQ